MKAIIKSRYRIKRNHRLILLELSIFELAVIILMYLSSVFLPDFLSVAIILLGTVLMCTFNLNLLNKRTYFAVGAFLPILISSMQNIYLGIISPYITSFEVQFSLMIPFLYTLIFIVCFLFKFKKSDFLGNRYIRLVFFIVLYTLILLLAYRTNFVSFIAGMRNILSPLCFVIFGLITSKYLLKNDLFFLLIVLGTLVCLFGLYEIMFNQGLWISLNISELWQKKGISVASWGLPSNFVSSEFIFGRQIRRMSSTFADPVNLGAFLFVYFMICWYKKYYGLSILALVSILLTVSKGAILGLLIFVFIKTVFLKHKEISLIVFASIVIFGMMFIAYSFNNSSGSLFAHLSGFTSGVRSLFTHPLGVGVGNVGVIANLNNTNVNPSIAESGFGIIVGTLGWVGLTIYVVFYASLLMDIMHKSLRKKDKVLCLTLVFSMMLNIMFNEVALSPNSCGFYFLTTGILIGSGNIFLYDNLLNKVIFSRNSIYNWGYKL